MQNPSEKAMRGILMNTAKISDILASILMLLGSVTQAELPKLEEAARETGIPLGRLLVMAKRLSEEELTAALTAAKSVISGEASLYKASILLNYSLSQKIPFHSTWQRTAFKEVTPVVLLLIASGFLDTTEIVGLAVRATHNQRVGGLELYKAGLISLDKWRETLELALRVKRREISVRKIMCETNDSSITGELPVCRANDAETVWLGQLLLQAGMLTEKRLLIYLERGLESNEPLGRILVNEKAISVLELTTALRLQRMIRGRTITKAQAVGCLRLMPQSKTWQNARACAA
jgi:hypothetical protein